MSKEPESSKASDPETGAAQGRTRSEQTSTHAAQVRTQTEQATTSAAQAETRAEQATTRSTQAATHSEQASTRTKQTATQAAQDQTRDAQAETQIEQDQTRATQAETQSRQANIHITEQALSESELSYRRLFEAAKDGILILDVETGRINDVNPFLVELLGFSRGEMLGKTVGELSPFKDVVSNQAMLERLQKEGYVRYEDLPLKTKDGRDIAVEFVSNVYRAGDQQVIQCNIRDITNRKQAELALNTARKVLEEIVNALPVRVFWKDKNLVYLGCNTVFAQDAGFAVPADIIGKEDRQLVWREQAEKYRRDDRQVIVSGQSKLLFEETQTTPAGNTITVLSSKLPMRDARGEIIGVLGTYMDITERNQSAESLRLLGPAVEQSRESIVITDAELDLPGPKIVFVNPAFTQMTGYTAAEAVGKTPRILQGPRTDKTVLRQIRRNLERGEAFAGEAINYRKDGKEFILEWQIAPIRSAGGKITHFVATQHDITGRKRMQESHNRLAMAVEQAAETIVISDTEGTIVYVNPAFEKTTGYTRAEALGQNLRILKSDKQDAAFYRRMWEMLGCGQVWQGHFINRRKDGKLFEEEATISPIRDAGGKIVNYVAVKRDVTREVQLAAQFRQAQKMEAVGTLAGGVAHDFNNILAVIQMQASLLKSGGGLSGAQSDLADDIGSAIQRAVGLTRQLLLFSRKEVLQPRALDLNHSVVEMTKMLTRTLGENIAVHLKLAVQPMSIHADPGMMDQVLMNLCVNARDAMPNGGQLIIATAGVDFDDSAATQTAQARPGSFVRLSVIDNGCGIPPENLAKIFEPFFTTKAVGKGTGLGLATVFGIAQQHQGWVNVQSEVGHGTTFNVYLPRLVASHDTKFLKIMPATAPSGHETILLVEDEPSLRTIIKLTLARLGYRVLEAATGVKALEVWKAHPGEIHLLLTDLMMPDGMTGKELGQRLLQENPKLKVIYMSGYSADIVAKDFPLQEGVNFLTKPFPTEKLAQTLRNSLDAN